ncbi:cupin domain-containing protein [Indiicoccus explosivorum]|uniref:cupin domain-containing protein n=1 Tax=Indiicoccus explosivorum TaxID=1917864 RepID=UPI000B432E53|nr:cupin domain-containing protein [Indiicoccus explosivorum]
MIRESAPTAKDWIRHLGMERHPEGGYYSASFAAEDFIHPKTHGGSRKLYTSIYFLLEQGDVSRFHRLKSDELWYFHAGSALTVHRISPDGRLLSEALGLDIQSGERPQLLVPAGDIFGSELSDDGAYALVGCMVSPGFDFADFELFNQQELLTKFPQHGPVIRRLT